MTSKRLQQLNSINARKYLIATRPDLSVNDLSCLFDISRRATAIFIDRHVKGKTRSRRKDASK